MGREPEHHQDGDQEHHVQSCAKAHPEHVVLLRYGGGHTPCSGASRPTTVRSCGLVRQATEIPPWRLGSYSEPSMSVIAFALMR